jgi:hypothetical protein
VLVGVLVGVLVLAALVAAGFLAARAVADASNSASVRVITTRQKVLVRLHSHVVTRGRIRKVYEKPQTVLETQTIHTPTGVRLVTHRVVRNRVVYRKHVVKVHGKTRTVQQPVTNTRTVTHQVTDSRTVTHPVTVVETTKVVSTQTLPVTTTVTVTTHPGNG